MVKPRPRILRQPRRVGRARGFLADTPPETAEQPVAPNSPPSPQRSSSRGALPQAAATQPFEAGNFFTDTDYWNSLSSEDLALEYIWYWVENSPAARWDGRPPPGDTHRPFHIAVATDDASLGHLTKRGSLVADSLILSHDDASRSQTLPEWYIDSSGYSGGWTVFSGEVRCGGLSSLGNYLRAAEPLLRKRVVTYQPNVLIRAFQDYPDQDYGDGHRNYKSMADLLVAERRVVDVLAGATARSIKAQLLRPVLTIDLPYLEGTSLRDYCAIAADEGEALSVAQDYLRSKFLSLEDGRSEDDELRDLTRLSLEIKDGVRAVKSDLRRITRKNAVQIAGGALAACTATLVALDVGAMLQVAAVVGAGGGLWSVVSSAEQLLRERSVLSERPMFFFWLLDSATHS